MFSVNLTSKKFSWAVTKHISDSFNLPESLAGFRFFLRDSVSTSSLRNGANYRIFRNICKG